MMSVTTIIIILSGCTYQIIALWFYLKYYSMEASVSFNTKPLLSMIIHYRVILCMVHSIIILKRTEWRSSFMKKMINLYSPASKKAYLIHSSFIESMRHIEFMRAGDVQYLCRLFIKGNLDAKSWHKNNSYTVCTSAFVNSRVGSIQK